MRSTAFFALTLVATAIPAAAQTDLFTLIQGEPGFALKSGDVNDAGARSIVIRQSGSYFLPGNFYAGEGVAIEVRANDVTIDLRGHTIIGYGDKIGTAIGITNATNVAVTNGKIQDFGVGVLVSGSANVQISRLAIDGQDLGGAPPEVEIGVMLVDSRGVTVRDNVVTDTFLGVFVRGASSGNRIEGNLLAGGDHGELAICYNPAPGATSGGPSGDLIANNHISRFRRGFSFSPDSVGNVLRGNTFAYFDLGIVEATVGSNAIEDNIEIEIAR